MTFAKSLNPDQAWQKVGPDLDPNCLNTGTLRVIRKECFENLYSEKIRQTKKAQKLPSMQRLKTSTTDVLKICQVWSESKLFAKVISNDTVAMRYAAQFLLRESKSIPSMFCLISDKSVSNFDLPKY